MRGCGWVGGWEDGGREERGRERGKGKRGKGKGEGRHTRPHTKGVVFGDGSRKKKMGEVWTRRRVISSSHGYLPSSADLAIIR